VVSAEHLSREEVVAFLSGQPGTPKDLEALLAGRGHRRGPTERAAKNWWSASGLRCPGTRPTGWRWPSPDLVHGDLLHGNVLVSPDARRVEAVLSWKCSVRGDFLFDAAWCSFWAPWHHCYELHIGFTHLGWNVWTGNQADLAATARRLAEVLERGPVVSSVLHQLLTHPT
jgi:Phosphotransferase enzyme family